MSILKNMRGYFKLKSSISYENNMTNSLFVDECCDTHIFHNANQNQKGYTTITVKQFDDDIISIEYYCLFYKYKLDSFIVSNELLKSRNESAKTVCKNLLIFCPEYFCINKQPSLKYIDMVYLLK